MSSGSLLEICLAWFVDTLNKQLLDPNTVPYKTTRTINVHMAFYLLHILTCFFIDYSNQNISVGYFLWQQCVLDICQKWKPWNRLQYSQNRVLCHGYIWNKIISAFVEVRPILFQLTETCLKLFQNYCRVLLQLINILQHVHCHLNNFEKLILELRQWLK